MAEKNIFDKVKELIDSNANASLKEAAQKWLDEADAKYGDKIDVLKEKGGEAWDKLNEYAEKYSDKSIEANEKLKELSDKVSAKADEFAEKAAPVVGDIKEKAAPAVEGLKGKAAPVVGKVADSEFVKQLKDSVASLDEVIDTFSKPEMKDKMGDAAEQIRKHAEEMKAQGKTFCDCPACTKAREILRDLGEAIDEPEVGE